MTENSARLLYLLYTTGQPARSTFFNNDLEEEHDTSVDHKLEPVLPNPPGVPQVKRDYR